MIAVEALRWVWGGIHGEGGGHAWVQPVYYTWMVVNGGRVHTCCCCSRLVRCECFCWVVAYGADRVGVLMIEDGKKTGWICGILVRGWRLCVIGFFTCVCVLLAGVELPWPT